ncbi:MAG TPA: acyl-CoA dehydrogenase family protein [Candidatus Margulisiibacteriota bacterium]|nr:acyl-CoA dehydrogenase family protein [Candidatus Margulisiibacteriota bacterium]
MDLSYTPEQETFRRKVRAWIKANLPPREKDSSGIEYGDPKRIAALKAWQRKLYDAGYVAMGWPKEYGGHEADVVQQTIVNEELLLARAPGLVGMMGIQMVGPTLIQFGTDEQKQRHLRKILTAEEIWCQGYSEPGSGSDLASLKTRADLVGDEFIVNGQKVWTSNAQFADWMFCLVRTDPNAPKHRGISYILIDMKSPGITVRPLIQMTGDPGFNEVFFEDVRVPRKHLVGELNQGWLVANATLAHERNMLGSTTRTQQMFNGLLRLARSRQRHGQPAAQDPVVRQRLADLMIRVEQMKFHAFRQLTDSIKKRPPGIGASVNKLVSTELNHDIAALAMELMGSYGALARTSRHVVDRGVWPIELMFTLGLIIGGGTSQIQKNIISERGLGMPRESRR